MDAAYPHHAAERQTKKESLVALQPLDADADLVAFLEALDAIPDTEHPDLLPYVLADAFADHQEPEPESEADSMNASEDDDSDADTDLDDSPGGEPPGGRATNEAGRPPPEVQAAEEPPTPPPGAELAAELCCLRQLCMTGTRC